MIVWAFLDKSLCEHMLFISLRHVPRKGMAGSYAKCMFYCLRHCQTICQSGCIVLYSHQYCECIPVSPHLLYLMKSLFITVIPKSLYWYLTVIFNLHFPKQGCQASLHVFISHSDSFWWNTFQIFCPFFNSQFVLLFLSLNFKCSFLLDSSSSLDIWFTNIF